MSILLNVNMKIFSERLKEARLAAGYTQQQMADKLCIRQQSYTRYETNAGEPSMSTLVKISLTLEVSVDYLLGLSDF